MRVVHYPDEVEKFAGGVCVLTMGALHEGHLSLIAYAKGLNAGAVVVTNFVNPTQFGADEDLSTYPRTFERDCQMCEESGVDVVFAPSVETVYPEGGKNLYIPSLPDAAVKPGLEDAIRAGHFAGVIQVVYRLFDLIQPEKAVFGEKDYQQLQVIKSMVEEEGLGIDITGRPTVREPDGLAMSSRNRYLSAKERIHALGIYRALYECQSAGDPVGAESIMRSVLDEHDIDVEYAVVRDGVSLLPIASFAGVVSARALIAGRVGSTRLIDNIGLSCSG